MKQVLMGLVMFSFMFLIATPVFAFPSLIPAECRGEAKLTGCSDCPLDKADRTGCCCNLSSVELTAVNVSQIILGVAGSIALLVFVIAGILFMISQGNSDKIGKATSMMKAAVIGIAIILLAGLAIQILITKLTGV